jgi:hypothetical protein
MIGNRGIESDVAARMDAYRGNPQALMQKYSQNQELIDLLALQKLKSEKEAAARDMQMKMAQQQAAQGQPPTIKDQREQEVMGMTKQEVAQQMGGIAQQQQQAQQQKMQQLLQSGVATLPAPGIAKMAGGGIVAFANGGSTFEAEGFMPEEREEYKAGPAEVPEELIGKVGLAQIKDIREGRYGRTKEQILAAFGVKPTAPRAVPVPAPAPLPVQPQGIQAALPKPPAAPAAPAAPVPGTMAQPPAAPPVAGIAALPDPTKMAQDEEKRTEGRLQYTPEQRKQLEENVAGIRSLYNEEMDPEARRRRQLSAFLRGAGGRTSFGSVMAGGSGASEAERQRGFRESVKGTELIQKKGEDIIAGERAAVKGGIEAGQAAGRLSGEVRSQDLRAQEAALNREVERLKVAAQSEANKIQREGLNLNRAQSLYATTLNRVQQLEAKLDEAFANDSSIASLLMADPKSLKPAERQRLETAKLELERKKAELRKEMEPVLGSIRSQLGVQSSSGMTKQDQDLVNRFLR